MSLQDLQGLSLEEILQLNITIPEEILQQLQNLPEPNTRDVDFNSVFAVICGSLSLLFNLGLILTIILGKLYMNSTRFVLIISLCTSNFLVACSIISFSASRLVIMDTNQETLCLIGMPLITSGSGLASFNLLGVALDQYLTLTLHLRYLTVVTKTKVALCLTAIWTFYALQIVLMMFVWDYDIPCSFFYNVPTWYIAMTCGIAMIGPPILVILLQVANIRVARRHLRKIKNLQVIEVSSATTSDDSDTRNNANHGDSLVRKHWFGVVTSSICLLSQIICFLPLSVVVLASIIDLSLLTDPQFREFTEQANVVYYTYGLWIPVIYGLMVKEIKMKWKMMLKKCWK